MCNNGGQYRTTELSFIFSSLLSLVLKMAFKTQIPPGGQMNCSHQGGFRN